jgi:hypothetical protein
MNKNVKSALVVVGLAAAVYLLVSWKKKPATETLTPEQKNALFSDAMGYRGGAAPSPEIEQAAKDRQQEALKKIADLGLAKEYDEYVKAQSEMPDLPSTPTPVGVSEYNG